MTVDLLDLRAHGIRVTHARVAYDDSAVRRASSDDDMVRLHFSMRGDYSVRYPAIGRAYDVRGGHHNVLYSRPFELEFVNNTPALETFGVQFPVERFVSYVDGSNDLLSRFCERLTSARGSVLFDPWPAITPPIEHTLTQLIASRFQGQLNELFVLSKSIELLVLAVEAGSTQPFATSAPRGDRDKLVAAREFVDARLKSPPTLSQVAESVGLNEYKLKSGFKAMFGTTVFAYLTDQRMELARRYLLDTDKDAAEIAFELGYATPQHFSHAFKKRFGVPPKSVRKNPQLATNASAKRRPGHYAWEAPSPAKGRTMDKNFTAKTQVTIKAPPARVWDALTRPALIKKYMMGADVHTDWKVGSPIRYTGEYQGKPFEERGEILAIEPGQMLRTTHFSVSSGKEDKPENYARITWELRDDAGATVVSVSQDNIDTEKGVSASEANWNGVLQGLRKTVEG
jgi:AraC family transcriptional activator of pyochelin receptor